MLGSHNSMSYLPIKGWRKILSPWTKCQSLTLEGQYDKGIRYFDIRVRKVGSEGWWYCHNKAIFVPVMEHKELLEFLIEKKVNVRIILDERKEPKDAALYKSDFLDLIDWLKYNGMKVDSAIVYWTWQEYEDPKIIQDEYHASVSAPWYQYILGTKWFAKHYNKKYLECHQHSCDDAVILMDYIEEQ